MSVTTSEQVGGASPKGVVMAPKTDEKPAEKTAEKPVATFDALPEAAPVEKFERQTKPVEIPPTVQARYEAARDGGKILSQPLPTAEHVPAFVRLLKKCAAQDESGDFRVRASVKDTTVTFAVKRVEAKPETAPADAPK